MSAQEFKHGDRVRTHNGVGTVAEPTAPGIIQYDDGGWDSLSNPRILASISRLDEPAEPEDKDDLYVEPEPLKEGDWCLAWVRIERATPDSDGDLRVATAGLEDGTEDESFIRPDAIVRPDAGQVPPWVKPVAEPKGLGAVVEAEVLSLGRHDYVRTATDSDFPWTRAGENYMANAYSWADLKNPKVIAPGRTEGGAS